MAFALTYEVPDDGSIHAQIMDALGVEIPPGLIVHLACRTDTGLRYLDVWQHEVDWNTFLAERLGPVRQQVLVSALGFMPPEPKVDVFDVISAWSPMID